jgi:AraC-like DNA-binding protein
MINSPPRIDYPISGHEREVMKEAIAYVRETFRHAPTLKDVAKHVHLSHFHFHRRFKVYRDGQTLKQFVDDLRMAEARKLLLRGGKTLLEIAIQVGYANTSHFSHAFKMHNAGESPGRWRKRMLREQK